MLEAVGELVDTDGEILRVDGVGRIRGHGAEQDQRCGEMEGGYSLHLAPRRFSMWNVERAGKGFNPHSTCNNGFVFTG